MTLKGSSLLLQSGVIFRLAEEYLGWREGKGFYRFPISLSQLILGIATCFRCFFLFFFLRIEDAFRKGGWTVCPSKKREVKLFFLRFDFF